MAKSLRDNPKKSRGRPATGKAPMVGVRMPEEFQDVIRAWASKQSDNPPLAAAIRRLVELGLKLKTSARPLASPAGGCVLRSSPQRRSKRLSIPPHRRKNEPSAGAGSPRGRQSFVRLASICRRRRGNDDESFYHSSRGMFFSERDGAGSFAAQGRPQAARSDEAKSARRLQTRRNGQGDQALGWRLRGGVRTSGNHTHGRARRAGAGP
jgi:hypothetical protein